MKLDIVGHSCNVPDFLIIGAAKSGTTSLYHYLGQHPDIFFSKEMKEPGYLCFAEQAYRQIDNGLPDMWKSAVTSRDAYLDLFDAAPGTAKIGEATPEYLLLPQPTLHNLIDLYGDRFVQIRLIALLRNPVERIWSHYWMMVRDGYENAPFEEATDPHVISLRLEAGWHPSYDYIGYGMYGRQLQAYREHLGEVPLRVVLFEDFKRDPALVCRQLFGFLGVDEAFTPDVSVLYNFSGMLRHPLLHRLLFTHESTLKRLVRKALSSDRLQRIKSRIVRWNCEKVVMQPDQRERVVSIYREDIRLLGQMLGRDMSHWLVG